MNVEISTKEARDLINLLCKEQVQMIKDYPKQEIYKNEKYLRLEELKTKFKNAR